MNLGCQVSVFRLSMLRSTLERTPLVSAFLCQNRGTFRNLSRRKSRFSRLRHKQHSTSLMLSDFLSPSNRIMSIFRALYNSQIYRPLRKHARNGIRSLSLAVSISPIIQNRLLISLMSSLLAKLNLSFINLWRILMRGNSLVPRNGSYLRRWRLSRGFMCRVFTT